MGKKNQPIFISKEDLYDDFINKNMSRLELANKYNCSEQLIKKKLRLYNIKKSKELHNEVIKRILLEKYGVDNASKIESVKEKKKASYLKRYGVDHNWKSPEVKDKIKETNLKKRGGLGTVSIFENYLDIGSNEDILKYFIYETQKSIGRKPYIKDISDKFNISYNALLVNISKYKLDNLVNKYSSYLESQFVDFLDSLNIKYIRRTRKVISPYELDFYFPEHKLAIEFNDNASHNSTRPYIEGKVLDKKYHYTKSKLCEDVGVRLIHIYEYEWFNERQRPILENIVKGALELNKTIYARKCKIIIKNSKDMREFFDKNNIQGFRPGKFSICLEYEGNIVMAYMFGQAFFGKGKYEWEVIRGATALGINVIGGASKIWKYFINNYNPSSCVYYIDYNYFNGNSMKNLPNMTFIKTQASFKNYFVETGEVKNRNPQRHKEISKLYKEGKVLQIYNAGTKVYVWNKEE